MSYFGVASRIAPGAVARQAGRRWLVLPRNSGRRMDNRPSPGTVERVPGDHGALTVESWGPVDGPVVYLVHGWGGWHGQLGAFVEPLVADGCRVIGFDAASHGSSAPGEYGPRHSCGPEMLRSLQAVARHYGPAHGVIAHSLGCAVACAAIVGGGLSTRKLALVSPNPDVGELLAWYGRTLRLAPRCRAALVPVIEAISHSSVAEFDWTVLVSTGRLPDALVIHDRLDKEVRYEATRQTVANWPGARLMTTRGLGHHRILRDPDVVAEVAKEMSLRATS